MDDLGVEVGDAVALRGEKNSGRRFRVVGRGVLPSIGLGDAPRASLGTGAVLTFEGLSSLMTRPIDPSVALIEVDPDHAPDAAEQLVRAIQSNGGPRVLVPQLSGQLRAWNTLRWVPITVAIIIAALTVASLVHLLSITVDRAGGDIAVLRAFGITAGQVRSGVLLQATMLAGVSLIVGVTVGAAAGRVGWRALQDELGVRFATVIPGLPLASVIIGGVGLALGAAWVPAHRAARRVPSASLRSP